MIPSGQAPLLPLVMMTERFITWRMGGASPCWTTVGGRATAVALQWLARQRRQLSPWRLILLHFTSSVSICRGTATPDR